MAQIEGESQRLLNAVEHPDSVNSAELIAEEIAARCHFMDGYSWDDDRVMAIKETPAGINLCIIGDESDRVVRIDLSWGLPGVHGQGESVGKWIPHRMDTAVAILKKGGWAIEEAESKWAYTRIKGFVKVAKVVLSLNQFVHNIERATDHLRFV